MKYEEKEKREILSIGFRYSCIVLNDNSFKCFGQNDRAELGIGSTLDQGNEVNEMGDYLKTINLGTGVEIELCFDYSPTSSPSSNPTLSPSYNPTFDPTYLPTDSPTYQPTDAPTYQPTDAPTYQPTDAPTYQPTDAPTYQPTDDPTSDPTPNSPIKLQ